MDPYVCALCESFPVSCYNRRSKLLLLELLVLHTEVSLHLYNFSSTQISSLRPVAEPWKGGQSKNLTTKCKRLNLFWT